MSRKPLSVQAQQDRLRRKRREAGEVLTIFRKPLKESLTSVLPITAIVLVLCFTITPISNNAMMAFLLGSLLLIVGMGLFTLGSEMSMIPLGEAVGKEITKSKKVWVIVAISFLIGVIITVAEPDLQVLAGQVPSIPDRVIIWSVALGVGVFLVIALLRILFCHPAVVSADRVLCHRVRAGGLRVPGLLGRRLRLRRRHYRPHDGTLYHGAGRGRQCCA